jgi:hypothetical protein
MLGLDNLYRFLRALLVGAAAGRVGLRGASPSDRVDRNLDDTCFDDALTWKSVDGEIRVNDETFHLKGT